MFDSMISADSIQVFDFFKTRFHILISLNTKIREGIPNILCNPFLSKTIRVITKIAEKWRNKSYGAK